MSSSSTSGTVTGFTTGGPRINLDGAQLTDSHGRTHTIVGYDPLTGQAMLKWNGSALPQDGLPVTLTVSTWMRGSLRYLGARTSLPTMPAMIGGDTLLMSAESRAMLVAGIASGKAEASVSLGSFAQHLDT